MLKEFDNFEFYGGIVLMEPYIADFLINKNIPKIIRYIVLIAIVAFIEFICVNGVINSPFIWGKIVSGLIGVVIFIAGIYLAVYKIHKN